MKKNNQKVSSQNDFIQIVFSQKNNIWLIIILVIVTFISFYPSLQNDFVRWDDHKYVTENNSIRELALNDLRKFSESYVGNYHPLTMISYAIDYHFFGLNPFYYHLKNLIFHLLNTVLVFFFIYKISKKNIFISFFTALLFGIHPMHVESVTWISERKDVLYTFYFLLGLVLYYKYLEQKKLYLYFLVILSFVFSVLAKSAAVVFPVVLVLIDYYENKKIIKNKLLEKIPLLIISVVFGIIAISTQSVSGAVEKSNFNVMERLFFPAHGLMQYLIKFFVPIKLTHYHPFPNTDNNELKLMFSGLIILLLLIASLKFRTKINRLFFGFFFFLITIALVIQFVQVGGSFISERYTYVPYIGIGFIYSTFIYYLFGKFSKAKPIIFVLLTLQTVILSVTTFSQTKVWNNTKSLWENYIEKYPLESSNAHNNIGEYYLMKNDSINSLAEFNKAINVNVTNFKAYAMRGKFYFTYKEYELAIKDFSKSLSLNNNDVESLKGRSATYYYMNDYNRALSDIKSYVNKNNSDHEAYNLEGNIFLKLNQIDSAKFYFNKSFSLNNNYDDAKKNIAFAISLENDSLALNEFNLLISENENDYVSITNRGAIHYKKGHLDDALNDFNLALKIKNDHAPALQGRSAIYYDQKQYQKTIIDISEYLIVEPLNFDMLYRRALCYVNTNQSQHAINDFTRLIKETPEAGNLYQGRGFMYIKLGNKEKALEDLLMANEFGIEVNPNILRALQN